jgi:hypothetical protein
LFSVLFLFLLFLSVLVLVLLLLSLRVIAARTDHDHPPQIHNKNTCAPKTARPLDPEAGPNLMKARVRHQFRASAKYFKPRRPPATKSGNRL